MDKKKTGNLIREARQRKNYTQSELGRMLGVTNKAVSRWENGESFPDIGVLESLSHLLELPIQDIVTGERAGDREEAVTEVVRLAKLQEQRKREKRILYLIVLGLLIYNCVIGICLFSGRGLFGGRDIACQVAGISMAGTLTMLGLQLHSFMGSVPTVYQEYLHSLLTRMLTENSRFDQYSEHFERCYLEELLLLLMRHSVMNEKEPDLLNSRDADILLATKYIYNNFRKPLTLEDVSYVASLSPTYFSKKFKLITGMGFKEYLNYVRLKHAQTALLTTNSSITDIALEYGFNDSNYFKDLFKKVYGKSPREYRKNPD